MVWAVSWLIWALLSALFAGLTAILAKVGIEGVNSHLATALRTVVILVITWGIALAVVPMTAVGELTRKNWIFLVLSGVATGASWLCYFRALQLGEASKVAPVDKLGVVFAIALAGIFLKERIGWPQCVGGGLIVAGALVIVLGKP
ncbi:MAG: rane protein [Akkermansiaceae bacterium]|nr:rane protein [Akkermansiaceae bacterium]